MGRPRADLARGGRAAGGTDNSKEFDAHFTAALGAQRWQRLRPALLQPSSMVVLDNRFVQHDLTSEGTLQPWLHIGGCRVFKRAEGSAGPYQQPWLDSQTGLRSFYWLDAASLLPPLLLEAAPGMTCLDMCAAPGGKSLILAQQLWARGESPAATAARAVVAHALHPSRTDGAGQRSAPEVMDGDVDACASASGRAPVAALSTELSQPAADCNSSLAPSSVTASLPGSFQHTGPGGLTCNEPDPKRRERLVSVLQEYLLPGVMAHVRTTNHEGDKYWQRCEAEAYDRVLIDAPCSSDRHIAQQAASNRGIIPAAHWSVKGCKKAADLQLQLLLAGLKCLKVGGRIVYSTCSMSPLENDDVVHRALARVGKAVEVLPVGSQDCMIGQELIHALRAEQTKHGVISMPDMGGWGPIYACVLRKVSSLPSRGALIVTATVQPSKQEDDDDDDDDEEDAQQGEQEQ